jgi:IS5 family transposase
MGQRGFWDQEERAKKLVEKRPTLERIKQIVPWEEFRPILESIYQKEHKSNAGRKPLDVILMFKMLILQNLYNISDDELEYQVNDRNSFANFLDLGIEDSVPDATTVWSFREKLTKAKLIGEIFEKFSSYLKRKGYEARSGQIVDATLVPVPKQRNTKEENKKIKEGEIPEEWKKEPNRLSQKDCEARWTKKNGQSHYGYKNNISIDVEYGFIRNYKVTTAEVHDSQVLGEIIDIENSGNQIWADSAYRSENVEWVLEKIGFESEIHERAYRSKPLNEEQKAKNKEKSKTRAKVEHVFGQFVTSMGGKLIRSIGKVRAEANIGLKNLAYNIRRYLFWEFRSV